MSRIITPLLLLILFALSGCSQNSPRWNSEEPYPPIRAPETGDIRHLPTGHFIDRQTLYSSLAHYPLVYVGEVHDNPASHRLQLDILRSMQMTDPGQITLAMEMFNQGQQAALDRWVKGELSEKAFLRESRWYENWGGDFELYRELLAFCRDQKIPVIGLNASKALGQKISMTPLAKLDEETRDQLPEMDMDDPYQRAMIKEIFSAHGAGATLLERFSRRQTLWDETMAARVADYMQENPGHRMLVMAGGWHINYGFGIPRRVHRRLPLPYVLVGGENLEIPDEKRSQLMDVELPKFPMRAVDYLVYQAYEVFQPRGVRLGVAMDDSGDPQGLLISNVEKGSAADKAGIKKNDLLLRFNGELLEDSFDLIYIVKNWRAEDSARIELKRDGELVLLEVAFD